MRIGAYEVHSIHTGEFRLDGGSMFGNVPKVLWNRSNPADEANRILLAMRALLLRGEGKNILVDCGAGYKRDAKFNSMFCIDNSQYNLEGELEKYGLKAEDITDVIITHLHWDHAGALTKGPLDKPTPTFPNATIHVQEANFATALKPNVRERASYLVEDYAMFQDSKQLRLLAGDGEILPGIHGFVANGHTAGMQFLEVRGEPNLLFCADVIPTTSHLKLPYVMGFDLSVLDSLKDKQRVFSKIQENSTVLVFEHDPTVGAGTVANDGRYLAVSQVIDL